MALRAWLTVLLYGILEGVTEWLPISSTGHLLLLEPLVPLPFSAAVTELFDVVVQLGAILAVVVLFWRRLCPLGGGKTPAERRCITALWGKVLLATLPAALVGLLLDDWITQRLYRASVVAAALIGYGVLLLFSRKWQKQAPFRGELDVLPWRTAFLVGVLQVAALVPGTSRSGVTVLGATALGVSRTGAAEFSFFLGVPTMLGASALKGVKFFLAGHTLTGGDAVLLCVGTLAAFVTSLVVMRFLMDFVRRHSFAGFGVYRILLGGAVLLACASDIL